MRDTLQIEHEGRVCCGVDIARAAGVPAGIVGAAIKRAARDTLAAAAEDYRLRLVPASASKLAEYRVKEELGRNPANGAAAELALIDREAAARGIDRAALLAEINARAAACRKTALLVGVLEAKTRAAIAAIPDGDADIETRLRDALTAAKAQADAAFVEAAAIINGGA